MHLGGSAGAVGVLVFMELRHKAILMIATITGSLFGLVVIPSGAASFIPLAAVMIDLLG